MPTTLPRHDKVAIFCETPFQLMLCLNAAVTSLGAKECVVFPVQEMYKSERKFTVAEQLPLIRHIYPVRRTQYSQSKWEGRLNHLRYGKSYTLLDIMHAYPRSHDFTAAVGIRYTARCRQILQTLGMAVPYFMVEEGIGEYSFPRNSEELCAATLPQYSNTLTSLTHICLLPGLFSEMYPAETVAPAQPIGPDSPLRGVIQRQFWPQGVGALPGLPGTLYFHQPLDDRFAGLPDAAALQQGIERAEAETLRLLGETAPGYQLKLHPRDHAQSYPPERLLQLDAVWEVLPCLQNVEDMLLISESSTALISPKLLFDQEPRVLVLEHLYPQRSDSTAAHQGRLHLFETVQAAYRDKSRFRIPKTFTELQEDLQDLVR